MNKRIAVITVTVLILAAGVYGLTVNKNDENNQNSSNNTPSQSQPNNTSTKNSAPAVQSNAVSIENSNFGPADITVKKGTTVTWTNNDTVPHTVTETDSQAGPASGNLNQGDKYTFTYGNTGTYHYRCSLHSDMTGTVTVTE